MKCLIVNFHSKHIEDIKTMVSKHFNEIVVIDAFSYTFDNDADYIILSGGAHIPDLYYEQSFYSNWLEYIRTSNTPMLGICFGCELIAVAYGCSVVDTGKKQVFDQTICIGEQKYCLRVHEAHRFSIGGVSDSMVVVARGENDSIEMLRHTEKAHIGVQFHPEMSEEAERVFEMLSTVKSQ